jgi:RNA polymerase sigma-70 factor, ECF subfamily
LFSANGNSSPRGNRVTFSSLVRYAECVNTFKDFYIRQRQRFFAYLIRRGVDYDMACDIMQESFARIHEKYSVENLAPQLLFTIGRNLLMDALRKRRKHNACALDDAVLPVDGPEHHLMVRDEYRRVLAAMRHLEDSERDLLSLVVSSELSYREIAELTGLSEANVKVKIHRARKKLRTHLGAEGNERPSHQHVH